MKNALSILGTGVYLPPARPVREVVLEAGQDPSGHQGWDNCCHALDNDHPSIMGATALRKALEDANVDPSELKLVLFAGMHFDIDIVWIRGDRIVDVTPRARHDPPGELPIHRPEEPADLVLEVPAGTAQRLGWKIGDGVSVDPPVRPPKSAG